MPITDISNPWRDNWRQALYRGVPFFVEIGVKGGGRRTVVHEFPKRDTPYAEDMGRAAGTFAVTGYLVGPDYTDQRDALEAALDDADDEGPGTLVLPTRGIDYTVTCLRYTSTERRTEGGYCQIDMIFAEAGEAVNPLTSQVSPAAVIAQAAAALEAVVIADLTNLLAP